jgi:hypothetical protein
LIGSPREKETTDTEARSRRAMIAHPHLERREVGMIGREAVRLKTVRLLGRGNAMPAKTLGILPHAASSSAANSLTV